MSSQGGLGPFPLVVGVAALAVCTSAGFALGVGPPRATVHAPARLRRRSVAESTWLRASAFASMLFLYGGVENSVGGWVASFVSRMAGHRLRRLVPPLLPAFYAALAAGRLSTVGLLRSVFGDPGPRRGPGARRSRRCWACSWPARREVVVAAIARRPGLGRHLPHHRGRDCPRLSAAVRRARRSPAHIGRPGFCHHSMGGRPGLPAERLTAARSRRRGRGGCRPAGDDSGEFAGGSPR